MQKLIDRIMEVVLRISAGVLLLVALLTFVSVLMRYLFSMPIPDHYDLSRLTMSVLVSWGIAYCFARDAHIEVDLLTERMPRGMRRAAWTLATVIGFLFLAASAVLVWSQGLELKSQGEATFDLGLPVWPWILVSALGLGCGALILGLRLVSGRGRLEWWQESPHDS